MFEPFYLRVIQILVPFTISAERNVLLFFLHYITLAKLIQLISVESILLSDDVIALIVVANCRVH